MSEDLSPPRRPLFLPVVFATVFLSVLGAGVGLILAARDGDGPVAGPEPSGSATPALPTVSGDECRPETQQEATGGYGARGPLIEVLTVTTRSSVVHLCSDQDGRLFYHANRGGDDAEWIEGTTALMLPDVRETGTDEFEVTAPNGTHFSVTPDRLLIEHADGRREEQDAV